MGPEQETLQQGYVNYIKENFKFKQRIQEFEDKNEEIINPFNGCDGISGALESILFDANGYIATSCDSFPIPNLYLKYPNGSFTRKSIRNPS